MLHGEAVDIVNSTIQSANVQECNNYDRGDIPEVHIHVSWRVRTRNVMRSS